MRGLEKPKVGVFFRMHEGESAMMKIERERGEKSGGSNNELPER